ncbi:MAG: DNA mismatch repair protein MutS [Patescibacteria group bacterium]|nr:DNA mismatch repair protein MutS [Patescibacteria group bacterium]
MSLSEFTTPMMKQYIDIKRQYADCILFFRMGDFYEMFMEDAVLGAKVLDITLTSRSRGRDGKVPMAGVPYHAVDTYLMRFVKAGYKVAICEQVSEPDDRGLVERDVIRVVTPGTLLDEHALDRNKNNYIVAVSFEGPREGGFRKIGLAIADISTGLFQAAEWIGIRALSTLEDELARLSPAECVVSDADYNNADILKILSRAADMNVFPAPNWERYTARPDSYLRNFFRVASLSAFDIDGMESAQRACAALAGYLNDTQKGNVGHLRKITRYCTDDTMQLDRSTIANLELFTTVREGERRGSLLSVLDDTITPMGGRMLRRWLMKPLIDREKILARHQLVQSFLDNRALREQLRQGMGEVNDIERIVARLSTKIGNPKDLIALKHSLKQAGEIRDRVAPLPSPLAGELAAGISAIVGKLHDFIDRWILPDPAFDPKNGNIIAKGVNSELDAFRATVKGGHDWIIDFEQRERERTGISTLKVRFNKVFGFYIEVSRTQAANVPAEYIRKQTLVNGERFTTPELKRKEETILTAEQSMNDLEYRIFQDTVAEVLRYTAELQRTADCIAEIDCLLTFAEIAERHRYTRPDVVKYQSIAIENGRHPVVERLLTDDRFVPNPALLSSGLEAAKNGAPQMVLLTGPNMAGKSVYVRQVALIVLMNQIGSFVPAEKAKLGLVDRIFVRSGASDVISRGLSTFMVEMTETSFILNTATARSLIVMDEIGRGTSTFDGIGIAWAVAEHLVTNPAVAAMTLFATHYHELQDLERHFPGRIRNMHMAIRREGGKPVFLHTLTPGGASHSFGIAVAEMAGVPAAVTQRAAKLVSRLEKRSEQDVVKCNKVGNEKNDQKTKTIHSLLKDVDINTLTPLESFHLLTKIIELIR